MTTGMNADTATPAELAQWLIDNDWDDEYRAFATSVKAQMEWRGATIKQVSALRWMVNELQKRLNGYSDGGEWEVVG